MRRDALERLDVLENLPAAAAPIEASPVSCAAWLRGFFFNWLDVDRAGRVVARAEKCAEIAAALNVEPLVLLSAGEVSAFLEAAAAGAWRMTWVTQGPTMRHSSPWPAWPADGAAYPEGHTELCSAVYKAAHIWARQRLFVED